MAGDGGSLWLRFSYHRRRAVLGRARLLRLYARRNRRPDRDADRRNRRDVPRTLRFRDRRRAAFEATADTRGVLAMDPRLLAPPRWQPLWPARPQLCRQRGRKTSRI